MAGLAGERYPSWGLTLAARGGSSREYAGGMAGARDERGPGPEAGQQLPQPQVACQVFPERLAQGRSQQGFLSSLFTDNRKCQRMLLETLETSRSRATRPGVGRVVSESDGEERVWAPLGQGPRVLPQVRRGPASGTAEQRLGRFIVKGLESGVWV